MSLVRRWLSHADAEGGAGVTREEVADGASDAGVSVLTGLSLYTENTYAATGARLVRLISS